MIRRPPRSTLLPNPTLFRSRLDAVLDHEPLEVARLRRQRPDELVELAEPLRELRGECRAATGELRAHALQHRAEAVRGDGDRKSTRLNSSHANISYAVFCLK